MPSEKSFLQQAMDAVILQTSLQMTSSTYHGAEKSWIGEALARFSVEDALSFFEKIGAAPVLEEQGKYFPRCGQASAVCELLERKMKALSVQIDSRCQVENICFHAAHAEIVCEQENVPAKHVILATGGLARLRQARMVLDIP